MLGLDPVLRLIRSTRAGRAQGRPGRRNAAAVEVHVTAPEFLLGKTIRLLPDNNGELRAADGDRPADPAAVERYLARAFGARLAEVRTAIAMAMLGGAL